ncbi:hypothetical protein EDB81DRAFT_924048 [Dactylonectria macrodidyma]|uniref:Uncharacterized protein n=1 Tax=Dactylonectria macrodidyma TaxID=307937 RepID=A0A9P9JGQ0_9HYPO|nr:hypothetical protein EDB81DRAFT_924048 [Dactylonectria macrodidyma]
MIIPDRPLVLDLQEDLARKYKTHGTRVAALWRSFDKSQRTICLKAGARDGIVLAHAKDRSFKGMVAFSPELNFHHGIDDTPGDFSFINGLMVNRGVRFTQNFEDCSHTFFTEDQYTINVNLPVELAQGLVAHRSNPTFREFLPQATRELVLRRQSTMLQRLNVLVDDILAYGAEPIHTAEKPRSKAFDILPYGSIFDRTVHCIEDSTADIFVAEETVLAPFLIRGELWPSKEPTIHTNRKRFRFEREETEILFEGFLLTISNTCHLEYDRAQYLLERFIQTGTGRKWFRRIEDKYHKVGNARVTMIRKPEELTRSNPQLHYMLRLCQPEANAVKAVPWIKKLSELHESHPREREKLHESEAYALSNLAVIIVFFQDLSSAISLPSPTRRKGHFFSCRLQELERELGLVRKEIDLRDFAVPIKNLMDPRMAKGALRELDAVVIQKTGTKMGFLYQDLVDDCFSNLEAQYQRELAKLEQKQNSENELAPLLRSIPQSPQKQVEQRGQKEKTRPSHSSAYEIAPELTSPVEDKTTPPSQTFEVGSSTAKVFSTLFEKSQARGSVHWPEFVAAMVDLGFSKSLTLHRPHKSCIEGYLVLMFAQRLKRVYGWGEHTFETA